MALRFETLNLNHVALQYDNQIIDDRLYVCTYVRSYAFI